MAILQTPLIQVLLWLVAIAAMIWILGPVVMFFLGRRRYSIEVSEDPKDAEPDGRDRKYEAKFRQFTALGFRPVGKTVEHIPFMTPLHWRYRGHGERILLSADKQTFVTCFRIAGGNPLRTNVCSIFNEGGMVVTASPGVPMNVDPGGNYKYDAVGEAEPAELLGMHARRVEEFVRERGLTVKPASIRDLAAENEPYSNRMLAAMKLGSSVGTIAVFVIPAAMMLSNSRQMHLAGFVPLVICGCAALFALMRWAILPSRVPMMVRMALMFGVLMLPSLGVVRWLSPDHTVPRLLDRYETSAQTVEPSRVVNRIVQNGPFACAPLLARLENPATKPETRKIIHDALVKLHGSDLGEAPAAWQGWCAEVRARR